MVRIVERRGEVCIMSLLYVKPRGFINRFLYFSDSSCTLVLLTAFKYACYSPLQKPVALPLMIGGTHTKMRTCASSTACMSFCVLGTFHAAAVSSDTFL